MAKHSSEQVVFLDQEELDSSWPDKQTKNMGLKKIETYAWDF